jgi:glutamyl-Q tRNA(Asp) synthetase
LNLAQPCYHHLPVLVDSFGAKLSKQTRAPVVDLTNPEWVLFRLLGLLSQNPPAVLAKASVSEILQWAISNWQPHVLRGLQAIKLPK